MGKGGFRLYVEGEDGSLLRVPVARPTKARPDHAALPDEHERAAFEANTYRREARRVRQNLRMLRGAVSR